ncbi:hypothetical protein JW964_11820 [candidate division KSB1 bacterium]|nr:hypothetical protein [candidate division KSB1 bacterium]
MVLFNKKNFLGLILIPFAISYFFRFLYVLTLAFEYWRDFDFFFYGIIVYTALYFLLFRHGSRFWLTLEHELTHIFFGLLSFRRTDFLFVTHDMGGMVGFDESATMMMRLGPYFFPTFPMLILSTKSLINMNYYNPYLFILGIFFGYHIFSTIREFHPHQQDLQVDGLFFSSIFIFLMNCIFLSCILLVLLDGWISFGLFLRDGFLNTLYFFKNALFYLTTPKQEPVPRLYY